MRILKNGTPPDPNHPIIFDCPNCGCKFEAIRSEYKWQFSQREDESWYEVKCPCCNQRVTKKDET